MKMKIKIIITVSLIAVGLLIWGTTNLLGCGLLNTSTEQGFASDRTFQVSTVESFSVASSSVSAAGVRAQDTVDISVLAKDIALAQNGSTAHIAYVKANSPGEKYLRYATQNGSSWDIINLEGPNAAVGDPSITYDSTGDVHIAWRGYGLMYADNSSGSWEITTVANVGATYAPKIMIDSTDHSHIVFIASTYEAEVSSYKLFYATNSSGSWVIDTLWDADMNSTGQDSISAVMDSHDKIHLSFWDYVSKNIKYATNASGSWINTTIAAGKGTKNSITLDNDGNPYIIYSEDATVASGPSMEYYATNSTGSWVSREITDLVPSSVSSSLYIREDLNLKFTTGNIKHLIWASGIQLEYLTNSSGSWQKYLILPSASAGKLAFDGSNNPVFLASGYEAGAGAGYNTFSLEYITELPEPTSEASGL